VRPATSPTKGKATKTGSRRDAPRGDRRKGEDRGARAAQAMKRTKRTSSQRQKRSTIKNRLLSAREIQRFGTWNVRTLRGLGKTEQLAREMKRYRLSILAVTETLLPAEEMVLEQKNGYTMNSGRHDKRTMEGGGACSHSPCMCHNEIA